jgi:hypothetical protein
MRRCEDNGHGLLDRQADLEGGRAWFGGRWLHGAILYGKAAILSSSS